LGKCEKLYANIENTNIQKACASIEYWAREDNLGNTFNTLGTIFRTTLSKEASPLPTPLPPKRIRHMLPHLNGCQKFLFLIVFTTIFGLG